MQQSQWRRVSRRSPCPVCGKDHWCSVSSDGSVVICPRTAGGRLIVSKAGEFVGYLHRLRPGMAPPPETAEPPPPVAQAEMALMARRFTTNLPPDRLHRFAASLGLNVTPLRRLEVGTNTDRARRIWTFPMFDDERRVVGISCRAADGGKFCVRGSKMGLFIPAGLKGGGDLVSPEGATSTAATLSWGFGAAGRWSNCGGGVTLGRLAVRLGATRVVLLGENDLQFNDARAEWLWPGLDGAVGVARTLARHWPRLEVRIVMPPEGLKDAREWLQYGDGRDAVRLRIDEGSMTLAEAAAVSVEAKRDAAAATTTTTTACAERGAARA